MCVASTTFTDFTLNETFCREEPLPFHTSTVASPSTLPPNGLFISKECLSIGVTFTAFGLDERTLNPSNTPSCSGVTVTTRELKEVTYISSMSSFTESVTPDWDMVQSKSPESPRVSTAVSVNAAAGVSTSAGFISFI